jgi:hypothetical protein
MELPSDNCRKTQLYNSQATISRAATGTTFRRSEVYRMTNIVRLSLYAAGSCGREEMPLFSEMTNSTPGN